MPAAKGSARTPLGPKDKTVTTLSIDKWKTKNIEHLANTMSSLDEVNSQISPGVGV